MTALWRVELHSHTVWSKDCLVEFEKIIQRCEKRAIDRIAITDHNTADGALAMQKIAPDLVIVGEEIMTTHGEMLGYYMQESIPAGLTPEETIRLLREQGAVISVSHPFDRLRKGAWREEDLLKIIHLVDAIEIFNSRCIYKADNDRAAAFAEAHRLCGTAGSDAHTVREYGQAVTLLQPFHDAPTFLDAIRQAQYDKNYSSHFVHLGSTYAKWLKRLGLKKRLWAGG
ncbi:MAG: PHP domain-containing protein [Chloroflexi bacterium]|nr:MAG: histidinol-phosphatase [Phototrophicales bacterium]RMF79115.1 MAG: PHP domain-containing protein [Chloroflexota bacterium]